MQTLTVVQGGSIHSGPGGEHTNEDCVTNRQTGDRVYTRVLIRPYTRNSRRQARSTLTRVRGGGRRVTGVVRGTQFDQIVGCGCACPYVLCRRTLVSGLPTHTGKRTMHNRWQDEPHSQLQAPLPRLRGHVWWRCEWPRTKRRDQACTRASMHISPCRPSGPLTSVRSQPRKRRLRVWRPTLGASTTVPAAVNGHIDQLRD